MSNLDFKITQKMVNLYHLHKQTTGSKLSNLHRLWGKELGMNLDANQIRWITECMTGKRSMNVYNRHGNQWITTQQVLQPSIGFSKGMAPSLDEMSDTETKTITKALRSWL